MLNNDDIKKAIDIPKELDEAIAFGIKRGKKEKKKRFKIPKSLVAAALTIVVGGSVIAVKPDLVRAIPGIGSIFTLIKEDRLGTEMKMFENFKTAVNKSIESNRIKVVIDEISIDDNMLGVSFIVEGENLNVDGKKFKEELDFRSHIHLDKQLVESMDWKCKRIGENKLAGVLVSNIADLDIKDEVDFSWDIKGIDDTIGNWNFNFKVKKGDEVKENKVIKVNEIKEFEKFRLNIDKIVVTPFSSTINYSGEYKELNLNPRYGIGELLVLTKDDKILYTKSCGFKSSNKKFDGKIEIWSDISKLDSIKIVPVFEKRTTGGLNEVMQCNFNKGEETEIITKTRPVTDRERKDGYGLNEVTYNLNIDKSHKFLTLDELKNSDIWINDEEYVTLQNIEDKGKKTKLTFKINGKYTYRVVSSLVVFDENFNDTKLHEGEMSRLEDSENKIESIELDKLDNNKRYKFALSKIEIPKLDKNNIIDISLSNK